MRRGRRRRSSPPAIKAGMRLIVMLLLEKNCRATSSTFDCTLSSRASSIRGAIKDCVDTMAWVRAMLARQFFSNSNITINLIPALIAGGLLLLLLPLLFLFLAPADDGGTGYGAPAAEYGAPSSSYGAPSSSYGYRADEGYEEGSYRSLLTDLLDSNA